METEDNLDAADYNGKIFLAFFLVSTLIQEFVLQNGELCTHLKRIEPIKQDDDLLLKLHFKDDSIKPGEILVSFKNSLSIYQSIEEGLTKGKKYIKENIK